MDNLEEREKFLETYKLPQPNQEEIGNMNRTTTSTEYTNSVSSIADLIVTNWVSQVAQW